MLDSSSSKKDIFTNTHTCAFYSWTFESLNTCLKSGDFCKNCDYLKKRVSHDMLRGSKTLEERPA